MFDSDFNIAYVKDCNSRKVTLMFSKDQSRFCLLPLANVTVRFENNFDPNVAGIDPGQ